MDKGPADRLGSPTGRDRPKRPPGGSRCGDQRRRDYSQPRGAVLRGGLLPGRAKPRGGEYLLNRALSRATPGPASVKAIISRALQASDHTRPAKPDTDRKLGEGRNCSLVPSV